MSVVPQQLVLVAAVKRADVDIAVRRIGGDSLRESHAIWKHRERVNVAIDEQLPGVVVVREDRPGTASDGDRQQAKATFQDVFHLLSLRIVDGTNAYDAQESSRNQPVFDGAAPCEED
jgi:hypothetical protein